MRRLVWACGAVTAAAALAIVALFVNYLAAVAVVAALLWFALWRTLRRARKEVRAINVQAGDPRGAYETVIGLLIAALGLEDSGGGIQVQRTARVASAVAYQMGLRKHEIRLVEKAAILHDVGKMGVAETVLSKAGALSEQEWAQMKPHPEVGYGALKRIAFLNDVADVLLTHHERWDGQGYPRGLKGEEIPLAARIFAVAAAYEAMTSDRPYRRAMSHANAVAEIIRNSGTQFDPEVVRAFVEAERRRLFEHEGRPPEEPGRFTPIVSTRV